MRTKCLQRGIHCQGRPRHLGPASQSQCRGGPVYVIAELCARQHKEKTCHRHLRKRGWVPWTLRQEMGTQVLRYINAGGAVPYRHVFTTTGSVETCKQHTDNCHVGARAMCMCVHLLRNGSSGVIQYRTQCFVLGTRCVCPPCAICSSAWAVRSFFIDSTQHFFIEYVMCWHAPHRYMLLCDVTFIMLHFRHAHCAYYYSMSS